MRILVIAPSWIGDMLMSQSLYRTLKTLHPKGEIDVIAPDWSRPLLSYMPEVNKAIPMNLSHGALDINLRRQLGHSLRKKCYHHAYILPNSFKSALIPFFAGIPNRTGWLGEMRYMLLNDVRILNEQCWPMMVERYVALAYEKGMMRSAKDLPPFSWPQLQVDTSLKTKTCSLFGISSERQIIGLCPGAEFSQKKCWPHYHYAELANLLIEEGYQILLFGSEKDCKSSNEIIGMIATKKEWCCNLVGKTKLEQAVILIASCKAVVCNDSGLMHISAAVKRPIIALYGPTSPYFTPPLSCKARIIRLIHDYHKVCKNDSKKAYHSSLINISPKFVFEVLKELLLIEDNNIE